MWMLWAVLGQADATIPAWNLATSLAETNYNTLGAGGEHSCVINPKNETELWCWGKGSYGRLGLGTNTDRPVPTKLTNPALPAGMGWAQVSLGGEFSCAVTTETSAANRLYCWGRSQYGQLGANVTTSQLSPVPSVDLVRELPIEGVLHLAAGSLHTAIIRDNGFVMTTGYNAYSSQFQLGIGITTAEKYAFTYTERYGLPEDVCDYQTALHVATSRTTTTVLDADGLGYSSGSQGVADIYLLGFNPATKPDQHAWGFQYWVEAYDGTTPPYDALGGLMQADSTDNSMCGIVDSGVPGDKIGQAYCWGQGDRGRLGDNNTSSHAQPATAVRLSATEYLSDAVKVSSGYAHACAVRSGGGVVCWGARNNSDAGRSYSGMLGDGVANGENGVATPVVKCSGGALTGAVNVQVGMGHTLAYVYDGVNYTLYGWGDNAAYQLGDGTTTDSSCAKVIKVF